MKIYYQIKDKGIEILKCFEDDSKVFLPESIENIPVTSIAPYAFSNRGEEYIQGYRIYETKRLFSDQKELALAAGATVQEVILPNTVTEIGRYVFYGCRNLKRLEFSNVLKEIGSGAFTGCKALSKLCVHMQKGNQSCVNEILGELWQQMSLVFLYEQEGEKASLVFPEHYEEAVENTPARLLYTQHHGSGNDYRQCFYNREMHYEKYDSLVAKAVAREQAEVFSDIVFTRLVYPYKLSAPNRMVYVEIIYNYYKEMLAYLVSAEKTDCLHVLSEQLLWHEFMLEFALEQAWDNNKTELTSWLMQEKQRLFPTRQKKFIL